MEKLHRGVNIGGWISQSSLTKEHIESFIHEEDFAQIAEWGFDHVRLPMDYQVFQSDEEPYPLIEYGFEKVDLAMEWAGKNGLNLVLDLHHAPGFAFHQQGKNTLFTDPAMQQRMIDLWQAFATRYLSAPEGVFFELINEMLVDDPELWNALAKRLIAGIREIDRTHTIIVGPRNYNAAPFLKELPIFEDEVGGGNILYTFHNYEPFMFTHQKASWSAITRFYSENVPYPNQGLPNLEPMRRRIESEDPEMMELLESNNMTRQRAMETIDQWRTMGIDKTTIQKAMDHAIDFRNKNDVPIYCGEFGAILHADGPSRERYYADFVSICDEYDIPYAVWSYKGMGFGLIDNEGEIVNERIIEILGKGA
jgi:hypothetical protein